MGKRKSWGHKAEVRKVKRVDSGQRRHAPGSARVKSQEGALEGVSTGGEDGLTVKLFQGRLVAPGTHTFSEDAGHGAKPCFEDFQNVLDQGLQAAFLTTQTFDAGVRRLAFRGVDGFPQPVQQVLSAAIQAKPTFQRYQIVRNFGCYRSRAAMADTSTDEREPLTATWCSEVYSAPSYSTGYSRPATRLSFTM